MLKILNEENVHLSKNKTIQEQSYETLHKKYTILQTKNQQDLKNVLEIIKLRKENKGQNEEIEHLREINYKKDREIKYLKLQLEEQESQQKIGSEFYRIAQEKIKRDVSNTLWH